jgi:hypothetical protein
LSGLYSFSGNSASGSYNFTTDFGIIVDVFFEEGAYIFPKYPNFKELTYQFGIRTTEPVKGDPKVKSTIIYILYSHFAVNPNSILIWICDNLDGKHLLRNRKFNSWFLDCQDRDYVKLNTEIIVESEDGSTSSFVSIVYLQDNPHAEEITAAFNNLEADFDDKDLSIQD